MGRVRKNRRTLLGNINTSYVYISNRMTEAYENKYGFYCDLYFPKHPNLPDTTNLYDGMNIFEPHQQAQYGYDPDVRNAKFYIPFLLKRENMNSSDLEFDSMYLEEGDQRPFIETSKKRELPIQTKVIVHIGESTMGFWVDLKKVVNGASGQMLLRMYLAPLEEN